MEAKFKIGDKVWFAEVRSVQKSVRCPECFGLKYLTVILGDQSEVTIDCAGCAAGYDPPKGFVIYYSWEPNVKQLTIKGMDLRDDSVTYWFVEGYGTEGLNVFANQEAAEIHALELAKEHEQQELEKIHRKEKNNRTWSWNAHYHRACIRSAEKDLVHHKAKLEVAKLKSKDEKKEAAS